jgi:hypothetical protein
MIGQRHHRRPERPSRPERRIELLLDLRRPDFSRPLRIIEGHRLQTPRRPHGQYADQHGNRDEQQRGQAHDEPRPDRHAGHRASSEINSAFP